MISHTLYFFYNNSLLHGHENYRTLIFVVIDFDPEKNRKKRWCKFFGIQYITLCRALYCDITNILNRHLPAFLYLPGTTLLLRASARELPIPFLSPLVWRGRGVNPRPTAPEADALATELSGAVRKKQNSRFRL